MEHGPHQDLANLRQELRTTRALKRQAAGEALQTLEEAEGIVCHLIEAAMAYQRQIPP